MGKRKHFETRRGLFKPASGQQQMYSCSFPVSALLVIGFVACVVALARASLDLINRRSATEGGCIVTYNTRLSVEEVHPS